jgi:hypothetical protein
MLDDLAIVRVASNTVQPIPRSAHRGDLRFQFRDAGVV